MKHEEFLAAVAKILGGMFVVLVTVAVVWILRQISSELRVNRLEAQIEHGMVTIQ